VLPEAIELLLIVAAIFAMALVFSPPGARRHLLVKGGTGLLGTAAIVAVPTVDLAVLVLLGLALLDAAAGGKRPFAIRLRLPALAVALLALALAFSRFAGPDALERFAAVGLAAGVAAAVGVVPYLHAFDPEEGASSSPIVWIAFVGPVLATVLVWRAHGLLSADAGSAFGAMLIGLGLINMAWGSLGAWLTENTVVAWRYSFVADWGLVLCGFGLTIADGQRAALLVLFTIVLGRLPLYLGSRHALREKIGTERPVNLIVGAVLAGAAPSAGFAARVLLLRGATQLYWPLALVLVLGMLLWLPGSLRLGRSLGRPRGRQAIGVVIVVAINVLAGLYPLPLFSAANL
jgi:NADH:ubiquinone oxidoreductase subunit 2 (subunit N)